jgi:hypothetical protein
MKMLSLLALLPLAAARAEVVDFEGMPLGSPPSGWTFAQTGGGAAAQWEIFVDSTSPAGARVLAQRSEDATSERSMLAIHPAAALANGAVAVRFKPVAGSVERAAGLVWRYRDENNYYLVRASALDDDVALFKVQDGQRVSLQPAGQGGARVVEHAVPAGRWSTLRVAFMGARFVVSLDGKPLFEVEDATFTGAGKVGLWTKADSVTYFDELEVLVGVK